MPKNTKRDRSGALKVFFKPTTSKQFKWIHFDRIRKFSVKSRTGPKTTAKGGPFGLHYTFEVLKKCNLVRESNPRSPASQTPEI